jgi:serine/threonine protein kinase
LNASLIIAGVQLNPYKEMWVLDLIHEHCEGGNLETARQCGFFLTPDKRAHLRNVMQVAWETSAGLSYLHSNGIVHGVLHHANSVYNVHKGVIMLCVTILNALVLPTTASIFC